MEDDLDIYSDLEGQSSSSLGCMERGQEELRAAEELDLLDASLMPKLRTPQKESWPQPRPAEADSVKVVLNEPTLDKPTLDQNLSVFLGTRELAKLRKLTAALKKQNIALRHNISVLYKTAKILVEQKDHEIANLTRKLDNLIFKRGQHGANWQTTSRRPGPRPLSPRIERPSAKSPIRLAESPIPLAKSPIPLAESPIPLAKSPIPLAKSPIHLSKTPVLEFRPQPQTRQGPKVDLSDDLGRLYQYHNVKPSRRKEIKDVPLLEEPSTTECAIDEKPTRASPAAGSPSTLKPKKVLGRTTIMTLTKGTVIKKAKKLPANTMIKKATRLLREVSRGPRSPVKAPRTPVKIARRPLNRVPPNIGKPKRDRSGSTERRNCHALPFRRSSRRDRSWESPDSHRRQEEQLGVFRPVKRRRESRSRSFSRSRSPSPHEARRFPTHRSHRHHHHHHSSSRREFQECRSRYCGCTDCVEERLLRTRSPSRYHSRRPPREYPSSSNRGPFQHTRLCSSPPPLPPTPPPHSSSSDGDHAQPRRNAQVSKTLRPKRLDTSFRSKQIDCSSSEQKECEPVKNLELVKA